MADDKAPVWKVRVVVFKNDVKVNTYYQPDIPQPRIEVIERMANMGASWNTDPDTDFDLKDFGDRPAHMTYQGLLNGDTVRREMTVVTV